MAGSMEFYIPLNREELLHSRKGGYVVAELVGANELPGRVEECQTLFGQGGPEAIMECFDVFYGVLHYFNSLSQSTLEAYWNIISEAIVDCCVVDSVDDKSYQRSVIKMLFYGVCQFVDEFESLLSRQETLSLAKSNKKKKAAGASLDGCGQMWKGERERVLTILIQVLEQDLSQFWDPPTPEMLDDITGIVAGCCYKFLENPTTCRDKTLRQPLSSLLGLIIKKYQQSLNVSIKMVQLVQNFEHVISPLTNCIKLIVSEYQVNSFVNDIMREIIELDPQDLTLSASATKNYSSFIVELSQSLPKDVAPSVEQLVVHLGGESYTMRTGVLSVFGEVIVQVLTDAISGESRVTRDTLLDKLQEHIHDVNAFVRSKSLQVWCQLCQAKSIPLPRHKEVLGLIIGRLKDKSSNVRKSALQTLTAFIAGNPFAARLDLVQFQTSLSTEEEKLRTMLPPERSEEEEKKEDLSNSLNEEDKENNVDDVESNKERESDDEVEIAKQMAIVQYYRDAVIFIEVVSQCIPLVTQLLGSKLSSDILGSLELLSTAYQFDIKGSRESIRKSLVLIWSPEQSVRDMLVNTYIKLYFTSNESSEQSSQVSVVMNLISLVNGATIGELTSLEEMVVLLIERNHLQKRTLDLLWNMFSGKVSHNLAGNEVAALILISMATRNDSDVVRSNVPILLKHGLKRDNLILAQWTCLTLRRLSSSSSSRFLISHHMIIQLKDFLTHTIQNLSSSNWCSMAEQLITTIYKLSESPDIVMESIIKGICLVIFEEEGETSLSDVSFVLLSRLIFVLGHTAKEQLIHLEVSITKELKSRRRKQRVTKETNTEIEDEVIGGSSNDEEFELELVRKVCNDDVSCEGLLGALLSLVVTVVTKPSVFSSLHLQTSATLTLSKYMLLSPKTCDKYLRLLFTLLESSPEQIRANIIISLGDLTVRYPNIIEPWTPHLYSRLRDPVYQVRHNTLVVLTHLILNDMIKVKGQISELALCLEDQEQHIVDRAKLFFLELSRKGNSLYNVLPDIISHLSDPAGNLSNEGFKNIMKYLLSFIEKDRHSEGLVEKLCHRFRTTKTEQQNRDIVFCLSQMNFSERGLKKLQENLPCYQGLLTDGEIYDTFVSIIGKSKKFIKSETKVVLEEFEQKLMEIHKKGLEEGDEAMKENSILATPVQNFPKSTKKVKISTVKQTPARKSTRKTALTPANITGSAISSARRTKLRSTEEVTLSTRKKRQVIAPPISDSEDDNV